MASISTSQYAGTEDFLRAYELIRGRMDAAYWVDDNVDLAEITSIVEALEPDGVSDAELEAARTLFRELSALGDSSERDYRTARDEAERLRVLLAGGDRSVEQAYKDAELRVVELSGTRWEAWTKVRAYSRLVTRLEEHESRRR